MKTNTYGLHAHSQAFPYPFRVVAIEDKGWRVDGPDRKGIAIFENCKTAHKFAEIRHDMWREHV